MPSFPTNPYIYGVNVIPSSGEFLYDTVAYSGKPIGASSYGRINTYYAGGGTKTDFSYSLDQLQQVLPNCGFVALTVQWMGSSLELASCQVYPSSTYWSNSAVGAFEPTAGGTDSWRVSGLTLASSGLIPILTTSSGASIYGGTPSDQSVVRAIQAIKARGLKVALYLLINMNISNQPWRGLITHSPDVTTAADSAVSSFFGTATTGQFTQDYTNLTVEYSGSPTDFTFRRFVLHYANLCCVAGGVNLFCMSSELRGIEQVRGSTWTEAGTVTGGINSWDYPAVTALVQLAADCRSVFNTAGYTNNLSTRSNLITYSPDWSAWTGCQHTGISGIFPHLDALYASSNIDLVSFDNYLPISDWTTGSGGLDAANWRGAVNTTWPNTSPGTMGIGLTSTPDIHDVNYLKFNMERGERFDYYYADATTSVALDPAGTGQYMTVPQGDRASQSRNQYYAGQQLFAYKMFRWWWNNYHKAVYDSGDGNGLIPRGSNTAWVPNSKSIMFMEYGFASIDRHTNQPNVFFDPSSVESGVPYWGRLNPGDGDSLIPQRDDFLMYCGHQAWGTYWGPSSPNNVTVGGVALIATDMVFAWNWDGRPFPTFPQRTDLWSDAGNWQAGLWLGGKGPFLPKATVDAPPGPGSYATMPTLVGIQWDITYTPVFSTVTTMKVSGRETRRAKMFSPLWSIELKYDRLRSDSLAELQSLVGFIESIGSMTTPFLFTPPGALGAYISAPLGTGDGVTTSFIVQRSIAGYLDTVQAFTSITGVYVNGTPTVAYTTSILPLTVVFTTAPANGAVLTISYSAAHLVRLASPTTKLEQITSILWQLGSLMLESVRS